MKRHKSSPGKRKGGDRLLDPLKAIDEIRSKIDGLDNQILELLEERAGLAQAIGVAKKEALAQSQVPGAAKGAPAPAYYDPERERRILARLDTRAKGEFPKQAIPFVYREIIGACRALETDIRVAYLGPEATYTQIAAHQTFGHSIQYVECAAIQEVFDSVSRGVADYGVVPLENSFEGGVTQTMEGLLRSELMIRQEVFTPINHCLLSQETDLSAIRKVYSHPQGLAQCRKWLIENIPRAERIDMASTTAAAKFVATERGSAAIASALAAEVFGLKILREGILSQSRNTTRFAVLAKNDAAPSGHDQTSLVLTIRKGGELSEILAILKRGGSRVHRIESKPSSQERWKYLYFVDVQGHRSDKKLERALKAAKGKSDLFKVLGSYPSQVAGEE